MSSAEVDDYLDPLPPAQRDALQSLRQTLLALIPNGEEGLSYGVPAIREDGVLLAGFAAFKNHLGYYPHSGRVVEGLREELKEFSTSKGSVRFTPDDPLPPSLVQRLLEARRAEARQ